LPPLKKPFAAPVATRRGPTRQPEWQATPLMKTFHQTLAQRYLLKRREEMSIRDGAWKISSVPTKRFGP